jgi:CHAD domain-containing protein
MSNILIYKIPDSLSYQTMIAELSQKFQIKKNPPIHHRQTFFDTFDWRLFSNGLTLIREGNEYFLSALLTGESSEKSFVKSKQVCKFWWDFPEGSLKASLKQFIDVRALLPLAKVETNETDLLIVNEDQKTVLRIQFDNCYLIQQNRRSEVFNCIKILPIRGYDQEFAAVKNWLNQLELTDETKPIFFLALAAVGKAPGDYSSKLNFTLQPEMTAREATKVILQFLSNVIKSNEAGIKADIDTEFVHDFRVAIRRTRSALSQIKGVFSKDIRNRFKADFAVLQKASNHLRDLDVYLLNKQKYQHMLPEHLRPGLESLFRHVQTERRAEHKKLVKTISANSYSKLIESWDTFLFSAGEQTEAKNSNKPIIKLARKFIVNAYNLVIDAGNKITNDSPTSEMHRLRIECKKLRYLLEFFSSLFPEEEISLLIRQLKKLQDNLGDYNDLSVQQKSLKKYLETITQENSHPLQISSAIGGLLASLYQQQQNIRGAFAQTFAEFIGQDIEKIYQKLFA